MLDAILGGLVGRPARAGIDDLRSWRLEIRCKAPLFGKSWPVKHNIWVMNNKLHIYNGCIFSKLATGIWVVYSVYSLPILSPINTTTQKTQIIENMKQTLFPLVSSCVSCCCPIHVCFIMCIERICFSAFAGTRGVPAHLGQCKGSNETWGRQPSPSPDFWIVVCLVLQDTKDDGFSTNNLQFYTI